MRLGRLALTIASVAPLAVPLLAAQPAHAVHCLPGSRLVTAVPLDLLGPARTTSFVAVDATGAMCAEGMLRGGCLTATYLTDNSIVEMTPNVLQGQSCVPGATSFTVDLWVN